MTSLFSLTGIIEIIPKWALIQVIMGLLLWIIMYYPAWIKRLQFANRKIHHFIA